MKIRRILISIFVSLVVISCGACMYYEGGEHITGDVTVKITNEVTNKVVDYNNITITDFQNAIEETVAAVERMVVGVTLKEKTYVKMGNQLVESEDAIGLGSGVIYKREELPDGSGFKYYVITNRHVVTDEDNTNELSIYVYDGFDDVEIKAELVGYDEKVDLALITFKHTTYIDTAEFADSDEVKKGSFVIAIGNPRGYEYYSSATLGIVSGGIRYLSEDTDEDGINDFLSLYIQHDAAINSGNSGGGLFTIDGKLLGINSMKLVTVNNVDVDNMGFAIPSNVAKTIITEYIEKGVEIVRPRLGVTSIEVKQLTPAIIQANGLKSVPAKLYPDGIKYGLYVTDDVAPGCTLSGTGLAKDDILLELDGEKIRSMDMMSAKLNSLVDYQIGDEITFVYYDRSADAIVTETAILRAQSK